MALMICKECGEKVSDKAGSCPHCGAPIKLDEVYSDIEKDIVTVKTSGIAIAIICILLCSGGLYLSIILFNITSQIYSYVVLVICVLKSIIEIYNFKKTYITLTNKRVRGTITKLFYSEEIDLPLRQIKKVSVFGAFGISNFMISNENELFQIGCAVNGKKFKKEYFNLIENKYKY